MENMQYAEELVREFLIFRGFTSSLQAFQAELSTEIGRNFQVDKILELIFSVYVPKYQADKLIGMLNFFKQYFSSSSESVFISTLSKLEVSVFRYYIVYALQSGRPEKVVEFFGANSNYMLLKREEWLPWFAIPYLKNPSLDPQFRVYFSKEWVDALHLSFRNFLSEVFNGTRIPSLLRISTEKNMVKHLKHDIKQLNNKLFELQTLMEAKEVEILRLQRLVMKAPETREGKSAVNDLPNQTSLKDNGSSVQDKETHGTSSTVYLGIEEGFLQGDGEHPSKSSCLLEESISEKHIPMLNSVSLRQRSNDSGQMLQTDSPFGNAGDMMREEEFPEVKVDFQETFLGHTSPISRCRFSASGTNIASASVDGTVRIWTYDSSVPTNRNATIYCGSEIMSLDWEGRSERLLLIGTADGGIKAWNVDAKRVVCDLSTASGFPRFCYT